MFASAAARRTTTTLAGPAPVCMPVSPTGSKDAAISGCPASTACRSAKRPVTVAFAAPDKWTYVTADAADPDEVIDAAERYAASDDGRVPWRERPSLLKSASSPASRRSRRLADECSAEDSRHHRHRLPRFRQDDADPPRHRAGRRPSPGAHRQRVRRRRR